jgi:transcription termination factor NusB
VLEKAILINGAAEILLFNNKEKIVISESNKIAKKYIGEDKPVKLITAILNQIKKEA